MKKLLLFITCFLFTYHSWSQLSMIYENSFRNWQPGQGWVIIDSDAIPGTVGMVNKSVTLGSPPSTEIMDHMLGVKSLTGAGNMVFMTPPLSLQNDPWAQFYSFRSAGLSFSVWVVPDANNPTLAGMTDSITVVSADGFNNINLSAYANTTVRLAFKVVGNNPSAQIDDLKVFTKQRLAYIPDPAFRSYLQTTIPAAFTGDSLNYTASQVTSLRRIISPNGTIASMEGLQYFPFLRKIDVSNNQITYFPMNRLPYLDTFIVNHNYLTAVPDMPLARYMNYDNNLVQNIPDFYNQNCAFLHANNNLIYDCLPGTNRFVNGQLNNNISIYKGSYFYYTLQSFYNTTLPAPVCTQSTGRVDGIVYFDQDMNGVFDPLTDPRIFSQNVTFSQGTTMITNQAGYYAMSADSGQVNIDVAPLPAVYQCTNPLNTVIGPGQVLHHDLRIIAAANFPDIEVTLAAAGAATVNSPLTLMATLRNIGTSVHTVTGKFAVPAGATYTSSTFGSLTGDTVYWTVTLQPFQQSSNAIRLSVTGLPPNQNCTFHVIAATTPDMNLVNNADSTTVFIAEEVIADLPIFQQLFGFPHDPNNKLVSTPVVDLNFDDYLYYTINFENIGTASASYVAVRDQLPVQLDPATFEYLGSTHPCTSSFAPGNLLQFTFSPIVLTATSLDPAHSTGSVWFRIKPSAPMQSGDTIKNRASIIFDTQAPVITNYSKVRVETLKDAEFQSRTPLHICSNGTVKFEDLSTGLPLSWEWSFEGAAQGSSYQKYPEVVYATPGVYDVKLITRWADGHIDSILKPDYVVVGTPTSLSTIAPLCEGAGAYTLAEGLPAGGSYSGTGVSSGLFDPAVAGAGLHTLNYTYTDGFGCQNAAATTITVVPPYDFQTTGQLCSGGTYSWRGTEYTTPDTYTDSYVSSSGCDSSYTLHLSAAPVYAFTENHTICEGDSYSWQGSSYTTAGTRTANYTTVHGCDSNYTLQLDIVPMSFNESQTICEGDTYTWRGTDYTSADTYIQHYTSALGCDSTYTLNLAVTPLSAFTHNHNICEGETYAWQGNNYAAAGTYTANYTNHNGCDSTYTLNLAVTPLSAFTHNQNICEGETYAWQGTNYTEAGTYTANYTNHNGCDSTYTLNLAVTPLSAFTENHSICAGTAYAWHGNDYAAAGTYTANYTNHNGCDSTYTLNLAVTTVQTALTVNGTTINAGQSGAAYQWLDCDAAFSPVSGETSQSFTPVTSGTYAALITQGSCADTSACVAITVLGTASLSGGSLLVYPNPVSGQLTIELEGAANPMDFEIMDATGKLVYKGSMIHTTIVEMAAFSPGVYMIKLNNNGSFEYRKLVKE